jgi:hypothetical protein
MHDVRRRALYLRSLRCPPAAPARRAGDLELQRDVEGLLEPEYQTPGFLSDAIATVAAK